MSFFGDLHPSYFGNVVKAMGSAKQGYPVVSKILSQRSPSTSVDDAQFLSRLNRDLRAVVHEVRRLTPRIVEVVLRAPVAARRFNPGQFYRMQNFETLAMKLPGTTLAMEGLALTGAWVDREKGLISVIALEMGGSADLLAYLRPGEPVVLMGPTGTPTEIPGGETVVLAGGGLGNAVLFSIGRALRAAGSKVIYFAGYKSMHDRYRIDDIEASSDVVIWCCDEAPGFAPRRPQDRAFVGNIVEAMHAYASGELGAQAIPFAAADRIIAIGSDKMMAAVALARHGVLQKHLKRGHVAIGSINSPMQCMMKEICAQCLQPHVDPATGKHELRLLLLQPGPAARPGRLRRPRPAPGAERRAGEADRAVDRALPQAASPSRRAQGRLVSDRLFRLPRLNRRVPREQPLRPQHHRHVDHLAVERPRGAAGRCLSRVLLDDAVRVGDLVCRGRILPG